MSATQQEQARDKARGFARDPYAMTRRSIPRYVEDAVCGVELMMPGRGMYREDRVAVLARFILVAADRMAGRLNAGPQRTAQALRRLADQIEGADRV